jgi:nitroreductase
VTRVRRYYVSGAQRVIFDSTKRAPVSEGDVLGIMSLGCVMENMWLMAESLGVGFHILSALRGESADQQLQSILCIPSHMKVGFACRLGYMSARTSAYIRVRRDLKDFVHRNHFGGRSFW